MTQHLVLQARLAYHALLLEHTQDAVVAVAPDGLVRGWNRGAERMYGWRAEEVLGRDVERFPRFGLSRGQRMQARRELAEQGRWSGEALAERKDGTTLCVEMIAVALRCDGGELAGHLRIHRDVTARKVAEEELRVSQGRADVLIESISDPFYALDRNWRLTFVNRRAMEFFERMSGCPAGREQLTGQVLWEVYPAGRAADALRRAMRERVPFAFECFHEPRWFDVHLYPSATGLSVWMRDITERRAADAEREEWAARQKLLADLGVRAVARDDLEGLLDETARRIAGALGVELVVIAEAADRGVALLRAGVGWPDGAPGEATLRAGRDSLIGHAMAAAEPVVSHDLAADPRFGSPALPGDGRGSAMCVVVAIPEERPFGALVVVSRRFRRFSSADVDFLQAVAKLVAAAVPRARGREAPLRVPAELVRVLLVDRHAAAREAIASAFDREADIQIVGQAASLAEARTMLADVDVAVVDVDLPDGNGADLIGELRAVNPRARTLVLSERLDRDELARVVEKGAAAALDKSAHLHDATEAVRRLSAGETLLALDQVVDLLRFASRQRELEYADLQRLAQLTPREREVLQLLAEGLDSHDIAERLHISARTERNHVASIMAKLDVHSRLQALVFAARHQVVEIH